MCCLTVSLMTLRRLKFTDAETLLTLIFATTRVKSTSDIVFKVIRNISWLPEISSTIRTMSGITWIRIALMPLKIFINYIDRIPIADDM